MEKPSLWVVYDHPTDLPHWYVARRWELDKPTDEKILGVDLEFLRQRLQARGLACIARDDKDDRVIVEVWI